MKTGDVIDNVVFLKLVKLFARSAGENVHLMFTKAGEQPYMIIEQAIVDVVYPTLESSKENLEK